MERDLFNPIKDFFEKMGFVCDGEVKDIDLYMEKGELRVAVELKESLNFRVLQQAALRQKFLDNVYIGIFRPRDLFSRSFKDKIYLLKRLGIGLIVVSKRTGSVEIVSEPVVSELSSFQKSNKKKSEAIAVEFQRRKSKGNTGGVKGVKLITGYREDSLLVLDALTELGGCAKGAEVKKLSGVDKSTNIMRDNFYGWFEKVDKGVYKVSDDGYKALEEFESTMIALKKGGSK